MQETSKKKIGVWLRLLFLFSMCIMNTQKVKADEVSFSSSVYYIYLGQDGKDTKKLPLENVPGKTDIIFQSSDESIVTVSKDGIVTAVSAGDARITCTVKSGEQSYTCRTTVKVRDNIKWISLKLKDTAQLPNALTKKTSYELTYSCRTDSGAKKNTGNYLYYEVYDAVGRLTEKAKVTDGSFYANNCGKYTVKVYAFLNESVCMQWKADPEKYAYRLLASDEMVLTVTLKKFATEDVRLADWTMQLAEKYFVSEQDVAEDVLVCSINTMSGKVMAASNIHIRVDGINGEPDFEALKDSMAQAYTKAVLKESWSTIYPAESVTISNLKKDTVVFEDKTVYRISYDIILKNIRFEFTDAVDISIERLEFRNTIDTWYDGQNHITVNTIDAYESLHPNITDVADTLVESFSKVK